MSKDKEPPEQPVNFENRRIKRIQDRRDDVIKDLFNGIMPNPNKPVDLDPTYNCDNAATDIVRFITFEYSRGWDIAVSICPDFVAHVAECPLDFDRYIVLAEPLRIAAKVRQKKLLDEKIINFHLHPNRNNDQTPE